MRRIGYARVSTYEQHLEMQLQALSAAGCGLIHSDQGISGADFERPGLAAALKELRAGDMLVVWRLDRLGRSLLDLVTLVNRLCERSVEFRSLMEAIDTSSSGGRLTFHLMAAMAEFERSLISERTKAGMASARARGKRIGRRCALNTEQVRDAEHELRVDGADAAEVSARLGVHPRTLKRLIRQAALATS